MRDYLEVLRGVEEAAAGDGTSKIVWRIVDASRNSPLAFELEAFPKHYAVNIDGRVQIVMSETAFGFASLQTNAEHPSYFTDKVLGRVHRIFERATNGLSQSDADFGVGLPQLLLTPTVARMAARNTDRVLKPTDKPYKELGSVEGFFQGVERDGYGRHVAFVRDHVTGEVVKCLVSGTALANVEEHQVFGKLHYRAKGKLTQIEAYSFRFFRNRPDLPQVEDIIDP